MFETFALGPSVGRLLTAKDDATPGTSSYAVLSYDYWTRRFGRSPLFWAAPSVSETMSFKSSAWDLPDTGTEPGFATDVFVPMAMKNPRTLASLNNFWLRTICY